MRTRNILIDTSCPFVYRDVYHMPLVTQITQRKLVLTCRIRFERGMIRPSWATARAEEEATFLYLIQPFGLGFDEFD